MTPSPHGRLRSIAVRALLALAAICAALAVINAFDEEISPEVAAYLAPDKATVPDARNAYLAMLGIAATDAQPREHGRKQIDAIAAAVAADPLIADLPDFPIRNPLELAGSFAGCRGAPGCLQDVAANRDAARAFVAANTPLLRRYSELLEYPGFSDVVPLSAFGAFPLYPPQLMQARQLFHVDVALRTSQSPEAAQQALSDLSRQIMFDRGNLAAAGHSLSKLLFAAFLRDDYLLLSDVLQAPPPARHEVARATLTPLTTPERSLAKVLRQEGRQSAETLQRLRAFMLRFRHPHADAIAANPGLELRSPFPSDSKAANFLLAWLYQPNAAINEWFQLHKAVVALAAEPVKARMDAALGEDTWMREFERDMAPSPFNLAGTIAARKLVLPGHTLRYSFFLDDLDGLVRLVALKSELLARRIPPSGVGAFLESHKDLRNLYTGAVMQHAVRPSGSGTALVDLWFEPVNSSWRQRDFGIGAGKVAVTLAVPTR